MLEAPLNVSIAPDEDLNDAVRDIYRKADEAGIWISRSFPLPYLAYIAGSERKDKGEEGSEGDRGGGHQGRGGYCDMKEPDPLSNFLTID